MAKKVDITEKLSFQENPKLVVGDIELEVNTDATTMLKIMGVFNDSTTNEVEGSIKAYELLFSDKDRKKLEKKKLQFKDLMVIIEEAMNLAVGSEEESGE